MKSNVPWSVKGIDRDAREAAKEAARREGMTVGEWLNQTIYTASPDAAPTEGDIEGLKARDLAAAIEHLSRRIAAAESRSAETVESLARSVGGAVERLQRLERGSPREAGDATLAARVERLEEKSGGGQRIEALRALERAVAQVAVQFNTAHQATLARLDATERQLQQIVGRFESRADAPPVSAEAVRDALEGMAARIARAEKIAGEAAQLKAEAADSTDADFVHKTGIRLRILGDEIKRGGDQIRALEATILKLSQQIDAAERRSAEGVQKVAETLAEVRTQFSAAESGDPSSARAEIEAAVSEIAQRTENRIETLQQSFEAIVRRLGGESHLAHQPPAPEPERPAPSSSEPLDDLDTELEDAFAALELEDPIPTPPAPRAATPADEFAFAPEEHPEGQEAEATLDSETEDVLAEIREAFGFGEDSGRAKPPAEPRPAAVEPEAAFDETPSAAVEPPPIASAPLAREDDPQADYLKAARRAAREAAAKAAAEEASGKKKLTPKQRAILAARLKRRRLEEASAKAPEALVAAPAPTVEEEDEGEEQAAKPSVRARVMALVSKIKARAPAARDDEASLDPASDEAKPASPNLLGGAASALQKLKSIPNAGGVLGLAAAIVLLLGASVLVFKDFGKAKTPKRVEAVEAPAPVAAGMSDERIEPAPAAAATIRPRDLYLDNIAALKSATTDAEAEVALKRIEEAAALGHPPAQLQIGELYKLGQLYDRDLFAARQWFERAANGGNVLAMHRLGVMAARGEGGPVDPTSSIAWFEKAASFGLVDSQYNLGATYHPTADGSEGGVQSGFQDRAKAYFWYSIAAKNGDAQAGAMATGLAASMPAAERSAKDAEVAAWAARTPDPLANELAPAN